MHAIRSKKHKIIPLLLAAGANPNHGRPLTKVLRMGVYSKHDRFETPLSVATMARDVQTIKLLLASGAGLAGSSCEAVACWIMSLGNVSRKSATATILCLLDAGLNPQSSYMGKPLIFWASMSQSKEVLAKLHLLGIEAPKPPKQRHTTNQNKREVDRNWQFNNRKVVINQESEYELEGESTLCVTTILDPPRSGALTTVRLSHFNAYGPFEDNQVEFFVRVGDPNNPTAYSDFDSASDWVKALLVEELVCVNNKVILRSEAHEPFEDETPWFGTYEACLDISSGRRSIEIKIVSHCDLLCSKVLTDWNIIVR